MLTTAPLGDRCGWMSADGRINYIKTKAGWTVAPKSKDKGGRAEDQPVLREAQLTNHNNDPVAIFPTRQAAVDAVMSVFAEAGESVPDAKIIFRPLAYEIIGPGMQAAYKGGTSIIKIIREDGGWRLVGDLYRIPQVRSVFDQGADWRARDAIHTQLGHEWAEVRGELYATRPAALKVLSEWLDSLQSAD